jgi:hypothetical protein
VGTKAFVSLRLQLSFQARPAPSTRLLDGCLAIRFIQFSFFEKAEADVHGRKERQGQLGYLQWNMPVTFLTNFRSQILYFYTET